MENEEYYVYMHNGKPRRIAKFVGVNPFVYDNGKWVPMASLARIKFEITDYVEISKEEAEKLISEI